MRQNAIALTGGMLTNMHAKTTHGLLRGSDRFKLVGIIDERYAGKNSDEVLDGYSESVQVFASVEDFVSNGTEEAQFCILGVATKGGVIPEEIRVQIREAIEAGFHIVNGLHTYVSDSEELRELASEKQVDIYDIRKPRPVKELSFWSGRIKEVTTPRIAVLGTDCAVGKRTTAWLVTRDLQRLGKRAEMIYTGQTGWMMGSRYGFIFDSTLNDFISGEIEKAIYDCFINESPDVMFLEGQSSLRNPSGPCGSEFLISGEARYTILQHHAGREKFNGFSHLDNSLPKLLDEIELIRIYGSRTIAIALNTSGLTIEEAKEYQKLYQDELGIPVVMPAFEGVTVLTELVNDIISLK